MSRWFLLLEKTPFPAAVNMARDEFLFHWCVSHEAGILRLYAWDKPSFSIGASQKSARAVDLDVLSQEHHPLVRRITGGKTVLHDDEVTYAVVSSEAVFHRDHDLLQSYRLIAQILVDAFRRLDIPAQLSTARHPTLARSDHPCFSFPTPNEIEIQGRKIVGSAQKRNQRALLQHGSIPFSMNYELYARGTRMRPERIQDSMITLHEIQPRLRRETLNMALIDAFQAFMQVTFKEFDIEAEDSRMLQVLVDKYSGDDWNLSL
ncbi:MAG: biotin/lipoate A/B protein ligase family protein [Acidobacteriota bacterium]|jgi:lipoate-protein ligase A|nr:biotin/lipoate A/B protein ligase family protein [Acidobacteriota bacterium]